MLEQELYENYSKQAIKPPQKIGTENIEYELLCCCNMPDIQGLQPWIAYDTFDKWYLQKCEGLDGSAIPENNTYICKNCQKLK